MFLGRELKVAGGGLHDNEDEGAQPVEHVVHVRTSKCAPKYEYLLDLLIRNMCLT